MLILKRSVPFPKGSWMHLLVVLFLLIRLPEGYTQRHQEVVLVFYNVENLFDTIDDPHKNDNDFLPGAKKEWNTEKYQQKLRHLSQSLSSIPGNELPAVIGFTEIENRTVLEDLMRDSLLASVPYQVILEEGDDPRGIDVALAYRSDKYTSLFHRTISGSRQFQTRHILYVALLGQAHDTLHVFVNHWKSRLGGTEKTQGKRIETASLLREVIDSLFRINVHTSMIIMGDFNDEPADTSVLITLGALPVTKTVYPGTLYNLFYTRYLAGEGSLWYRGWDLFDQIIVSGSLLQKSRREKPTIRCKEGHILNESFLLKRDKSGNAIPYRSYERTYTGGYSDHLPVYIRLTY